MVSLLLWHAAERGTANVTCDVDAIGDVRLEGRITEGARASHRADRRGRRRKRWRHDQAAFRVWNVM